MLLTCAVMYESTFEQLTSVKTYPEE